MIDGSIPFEPDIFDFKTDYLKKIEDLFNEYYDILGDAYLVKEKLNYLLPLYKYYIDKVNGKIVQKPTLEYKRINIQDKILEWQKQKANEIEQEEENFIFEHYGDINFRYSDYKAKILRDSFSTGEPPKRLTLEEKIKEMKKIRDEAYSRLIEIEGKILYLSKKFP